MRRLAWSAARSALWFWIALQMFRPALASDARMPRYALLPPPEGSSAPEWARPGKMRYARCDGGAVEIAKGVLSGWDYVRDPDNVAACAGFYSDRTIEMLSRAGFNWVWATWSPGFAHEKEAGQQRILREWIGKCAQKGIRVTAYISLTNMMIDSMLEAVPECADWRQLDNSGEPRPYGAANYFGGRPLRILACLNNPHWREYSKVRIRWAIDAAGAIVSNLARHRDGRRLILYLINYAPDPAREVEVELSLPIEVKSLEVRAPGRKPQYVPMRTTTDSVTASINEVDILAVLVAHLD